MFNGVLLLIFCLFDSPFNNARTKIGSNLIFLKKESLKAVKLLKNFSLKFYRCIFSFGLTAGEVLFFII
jgi:hypothetical protein